MFHVQNRVLTEPTPWARGQGGNSEEEAELMDCVGDVSYCLLRHLGICTFVASRIRGWPTFGLVDQGLVDQTVNTLDSADTTTQLCPMAEEPP